MTKEFEKDNEVSVPRARNEEVLEARLKILELQVQDRLLVELKRMVADEKAVLSSYWRFASKVLFVAATVVGGALAIIGWQGFRDVQVRVDKAVADRLDDHLRDSPPARFEEDVARLYRRAVINGYSSEVPRTSTVDSLFRFPDLPGVAAEDWNTLLSILTSPEADHEMCEKVLMILRYHRGFRRLPPAGIADLRSLALAEPLPDWVAPARRAYLIRALATLEDTSVASGIRALLSGKQTPPEVRLAALEYVRELFVFEAAPDVERLIEERSMRADVEAAALVTLSVLRPESKPLAVFFAKLDRREQLTHREVYACIAILTGLTELGLVDHVASYDEVREREAMAVNVLENLLRHDFHMKVWAGGIRLAFEDFAAEKQEVPLDVLLSHELSNVLGISFDTAMKRRDLPTAARLVRRFSVEEEIGDGWYILPHLRHFLGVFTLLNGKEVSFENTVDGLWIAPEAEGIAVHWVDLAGTHRQGVVQSVERVRKAGLLRIEKRPAFLRQPGQLWE